MKLVLFIQIHNCYIIFENCLLNCYIYCFLTCILSDFRISICFLTISTGWYILILFPPSFDSGQPIALYLKHRIRSCFYESILIFPFLLLCKGSLFTVFSLHFKFWGTCAERVSLLHRYTCSMVVCCIHHPIIYIKYFS